MTDEYIGIGSKKFKIYSLVDVDCIVVPELIKPYTNIDVNNVTMPVDLMYMLESIPDSVNVVFNQIIFLPNQRQELSKLAKKKNRHSSLPNPSNEIAVEDIKKVEELTARENKQLVYCHYNIVITVDNNTDLQKVTNNLENTFSRIGIQISQHSYNQLELFVGSFPGNCYSMNKEYDRFLTLSDAASCLMYKEKLPKSEDTPLKVYYTDRQGVPVAIDISGKEGKIKLTDNSNFFCLGPSGSGKSFHMNSVVRQLWEQGTDVVMLDTGNSYEGLCEYVGGKYISYLLTPATVCLAVPLYEQIHLLKKNLKVVAAGIFSGTLAGLCSILLMAKLFGFDHLDYVTMLPKSITTAIGMGVSELLGCIVTITVAVCIITGVLGNMIAEVVY